VKGCRVRKGLIPGYPFRRREVKANSQILFEDTMLPLRASRKSEYVPVDQHDEHDEHDKHAGPEAPSSAPEPGSVMPNGPTSFDFSRLKRSGGRRPYQAVILALAACVLVGLAIKFWFDQTAASFRRIAAEECPCRPADVPQYFQTSPELWPGPTATGKAAFLAQTVVFEPTGTYRPNEPLKTDMPVKGQKDGDDGIFKLMGYVHGRNDESWGTDWYDC
jgi:hypothetical protein